MTLIRRKFDDAAFRMRSIWDTLDVARLEIGVLPNDVRQSLSVRITCPTYWPGTL